jgi:hypothetical protein
MNIHTDYYRLLQEDFNQNRHFHSSEIKFSEKYSQMM